MSADDPVLIRAGEAGGHNCNGNGSRMARPTGLVVDTSVARRRTLSRQPITIESKATDLPPSPTTSFNRVSRYSSDDSPIEPMGLPFVVTNRCSVDLDFKSCLSASSIRSPSFAETRRLTYAGRRTSQRLRRKRRYDFDRVLPSIPQSPPGTSTPARRLSQSSGAVVDDSSVDPQQTTGRKGQEKSPLLLTPTTPTRPVRCSDASSATAVSARSPPLSPVGIPYEQRMTDVASLGLVSPSRRRPPTPPRAPGQTLKSTLLNLGLVDQPSRLSSLQATGAMSSTPLNAGRKLSFTATRTASPSLMASRPSHSSSPIKNHASSRALSLSPSKKPLPPLPTAAMPKYNDRWSEDDYTCPPIARATKSYSDIKMLTAKRQTGLEEDDDVLNSTSDDLPSLCDTDSTYDPSAVNFFKSSHLERSGHNNSRNGGSRFPFRLSPQFPSATATSPNKKPAPSAAGRHPRETSSTSPTSPKSQRPSQSNVDNLSDCDSAESLHRQHHAASRPHSSAFKRLTKRFTRQVKGWTMVENQQQRQGAAYAAGPAAGPVHHHQSYHQVSPAAY
ncbi:hypothetical protein IWQ60_002624 [Tieghemiomyces parasiticus]|uniref:Uncharacterized protein n=1 Tax=Tieghemiomyces parasiticus TaxID=78921 RepID=A0A9W8ACD5_9FUNG|nr:hypothetical protein IWQ60_002624 [Tieghemiomyces parasiticus]